MLFLAIPDASDGHKCRRYSPFAEAKEKSDCSKACEVLRRGEAHADDAPDNPGMPDLLDFFYCDEGDQTYTVTPTNLVSGNRLIR